ncbi:MAG: exopolysaccharide biosynthesis polyprenyl glycosylphosphotransferase [Armatimonadaceae bacterium]
MTFMQERREQVQGGQLNRVEHIPLSVALSPCGTRHTLSVGTHSLTLTTPTAAEQGPAYELAKRSLDVVVSAAVLIALFPVFVIVALMIFLEDQGPIFYYQTRVGKNGKHFRFYKFRSMVPNADQIKAQLQASNEANGPIFKMRNDPRITRVGRFIRRYSIDELPQLLSVLRGEMSLIGPRPHLPKEVADYDERQENRLNVQPGLLCFREVLGRSNMTFEQWVELDLLYVEYRSWRTDMAILGRVLPAVLSAEGAY